MVYRWSCKCGKEYYAERPIGPCGECGGWWKQDVVNNKPIKYNLTQEANDVVQQKKV